MQRHLNGKSGAYTEEYHRLLGRSTWIVVRHLDHADAKGAVILSEGDVATVFSQFGDVVDVRFVRHRRTGRFLGTAFVRFADYRSAVLAADEMNSNHETGQEVRLTAAGALAGRGIEVERCDEAEVVVLPDDVESYPAWVARLEAGRMSLTH
ncbi:putative RNA-binding protein [Trypanosoma rangeli]|uniref:Putative RNA-binding protein n=1 Tax=Trypanosoma rangeli TaxID=5698 RepID=A0A3R7KI07_TRYRA|nr:putative RNA-binding protein [Trypanosoma rangeli]RNF06868.1 putative RNA-binding protein [Trypanosoma rangeli]|eukprot:RNF06868.1 putative RNA-binding protein [Trypanosoma rangeli]